jgi:hypothetical protein
MRWIRTFEGNLLNLEKCHEIVLEGPFEVEQYEVNAKVQCMNTDTSYTLYQGAEGNCISYKRWLAEQIDCLPAPTVAPHG